MSGMPRPARPVAHAVTACCVAARLRPMTTPAFTVVSVYRRKNVRTLQRLLRGAPSARLWGLDGVASTLVDATIGSGPGTRLALLNRLVEHSPPGYIVVADDDVAIERGSIARLVRIAKRLRLDLCQPAQLRSGHWSHEFTLQRALSAVRVTNFVEVGPLVVIAPEFRRHILPFPESLGNGWGLDVQWMALSDATGARFGIVDAVTMRHLHPVGRDYDMQGETALLDRVIQETGGTPFYDRLRTRAVVRPWRL
jgi:hypothetical protein